MRRALLATAIALVFAGCYQPTIQDALPCSESHQCPEGQACDPRLDQCTASPDQASYVEISTGDHHTCAIDNAHQLWCWGMNDQGQLGFSVNETNPTPVRVGNDSDWDHVFASISETCEIKQNQSLWCMGGFTSSSTPIEIEPGHPWAFATLGEYGWCAIRADDGSAWCGPDVNLTQITNDTGWTRFATNGRTWCGVRDGGQLYCWGDNSTGQVGNGLIDPNNPVTTEYEPDPQHMWTEVAMAEENVCAIRADDGSVWCWGSDDVGEDGSPSDGALLSPTQVPGLAGATSLSMLWFTTCATTGSGAYCWGDGLQGELGAGAADYVNSAPIAITGAALVTVSVGQDHGCGLEDSGRAWCWGANGTGQLGVGKAGVMLEPASIDVGGAWSRVSIGLRHTCGIVGGDLWCWGRNGHGQLGDGTTTQRGTPVHIDGVTGWTEIAAGIDHTCGIAGGKMYCWGNNREGELGTNDLTDQLTPTSIGNKTDWQKVAIARFITCATDSAGALWCWGEGNAIVPTMIDAGPGWTDPDGSPELAEERTTALDNGAVKIVNTFQIVTPVTTFTDWTRFDDAATHGCGLRAGTMFCQGSADTYGELGDNGQQNMPEQGWEVSSATDWTAAAAGTNFSCGLEGDALSCWGRDDLGQLGDGRPQDKELVPVASRKPNGWSDIEAGAYTACGIQTDGSLWCWGEDHGIDGGWDVPVWVVAP